ncbi:Cysteine-rich receptor-like protein kinase 10 [Hibiscus syriacus]|uniref:Cysteine-rich receptor-like protein kinase 10 n=1 Tax=Hibiscus syriacus TaxID=106335 RepID=A0A6A3BRN0_HIBSY|nr:myosin-binding protein 2-like [Hibiscus syriacus]KAE8719264.1 Cysteine-rich receptor-like protein kinase 10 [Hibiscus syriacus]
MAANKFATMLHKNTNRITLVLVYVLLEWILIALLLLNSLFSYLVIKFADYFGLKRPCLWCSRIDHVFEPSKHRSSYRDLVCDEHANEISKLGFCSNHRRLSESRDMCAACLSSSPPEVENGDENLKCSCCAIVLEKKRNLPYVIAEAGEKVDASDGIRSNFVAADQEHEQRIEENKGVCITSDGDEEIKLERDDFSCFISCFECSQVAANGGDVVLEEDQQVSVEEGDLVLSMDDHELTQVSQLACTKEESPEILGKHLEFYIEGDDCHLIPVESMESNQKEEEDGVQSNAATIEGEINVDVNQANEPVEDIEPSKDAEEDKVPDILTSVDGFHSLQNKLLLLDRRESGTEDSLDGSVFGDIETVDVVPTVDKLKSALKTKRKALNALYRELEEERSASAVAASQTMAMINRLQEEKAAMQMEALQYQRMMEEQSEYDQEALQILNKLVVKREREKVELEKQLDVYRRKVFDYEAKGRMIMSRRRKDDSIRSASSASCSNAEDSDGVSVDLNNVSKEEDSSENRQIREDVNPNTPADAVLYLEESLASFEEERLSILEQLKVLEERLISLNDEEAEQHFEYLYEENGNGFHETPHFGHGTDGVTDVHFEGVNGKHHQDKTNPMATMAKSLLPLFDATDADIKDSISNGHENGFHSAAFRQSLPELESKKLAIEEEVDHVYERLQALEADREFIKHCISSSRKGDKGVHLLQEILQHLRDLRSVELRARSIENVTT